MLIGSGPDWAKKLLFGSSPAYVKTFFFEQGRALTEIFDRGELKPKNNHCWSLEVATIQNDTG